MIARPLVSAVTPSFNQGRFLEDTIMSVALQNYRPIEHIVIDGGSTDGTVDVLKRCAKQMQSPGYSLEWISEPDRGYADALGKGFARARGEIIGWLNSDDVYWDRFVAESAVRTLARHPEVDVAFGDVALISETGGLWMIWCFPSFQFKRALRGYIVPQPTIFFRRQVAERHPISSLHAVGLDHAWYLEIGREHRFRHVGRVQAADRDHRARRTHASPNWMEREGQQFLASYGNGYMPSSMERLGDQATRLFMRLKGLGRWAWIFLNPRVAQNLAFPLWIDSPWKVFHRQCTMRLLNRPDLGVRPAPVRWPRTQPLLQSGAISPEFAAGIRESEYHDPAEDTAPSARPF